MATATVNEQVFDALRAHPSIRILGDLPTDRLDPADYLNSVSSAIHEFITAWKKKADVRFLAVEVWARHTYFAIDLNNNQYDYDTAHLNIIILPVYLLRLSSRSASWTILRYQQQDIHLANRIADLHQANGQNPTPFLEDHTGIIMHYTPRSLQPPQF